MEIIVLVGILLRKVMYDWMLHNFYFVACGQEHNPGEKKEWLSRVQLFATPWTI